MTLKVVDQTSFEPERKPTDAGLLAFGVTGGQFKDIEIGEGEMFLLPGELCLAVVGQCELTRRRTMQRTRPTTLADTRTPSAL